MLAAAALLLGAATATTGGDVSFRDSWKIDVAWIAGGLALEGASHALDSTLDEPGCPCGDENVPVFDTYALGRDRAIARTYSDLGRNSLMYGAPLVAALAVPGGAGTRAHAGLVTAEAVLVTAGATDLLKVAIRRPRPYAYRSSAAAPDGEEDLGHEAYRSMPSGHTSYAFAAATGMVTVIRLRRPDWWATKWIGISAYSVAAATAYWRVSAGVHFPTDVVAGAALGSVTGWAVARSHERPENDVEVVVVPAPRGLGLVLRF